MSERGGQQEKEEPLLRPNRKLLRALQILSQRKTPQAKGIGTFAWVAEEERVAFYHTAHVCPCGFPSIAYVAVVVGIVVDSVYIVHSIRTGIRMRQGTTTAT